MSARVCQRRGSNCENRSESCTHTTLLWCYGNQPRYETGHTLFESTLKDDNSRSAYGFVASSTRSRFSKLDVPNIEDQLQIRECEDRERAEVRRTRHAVHGDPQGSRDLLLDPLRGDAGPLSNHFDVVVGHVCIRPDRRPMASEATVQLPSPARHASCAETGTRVRRLSSELSPHLSARWSST